MITASIILPWTGTGSDTDPYRPALDSYQVAAMTDITSQPGPAIIPTPNLVNVLVICSTATFAAIETDPSIAIIWSDPS